MSCLRPQGSAASGDQNPGPLDSVLCSTCMPPRSLHTFLHPVQPYIDSIDDGYSWSHWLSLANRCGCDSH